MINITENKKARFNYKILELYECGIALIGSEVKSLREKHVNINDSYAILKNNEIFLLHMKIQQYKNQTHDFCDISRTRKLLLKKTEIKKIKKQLDKKFSLIPTQIYLKNNLIKICLAIAKNKLNTDKREVVKKRELDRELKQIIQ